MTKTFLTTIFLRSSQFVNDIKYEFLTRMHIPNFKNVLRRKLRGGPVSHIDSGNKKFTDYLGNRISSTTFLFDCSSNEIHTIIKGFEIDKSSDISISVLKKCAPFISEHLSQFLNSLMRLVILPDKLKVGKVSLIFKKGDVQLFDNYRPILVLPIFGKIFEKIIYNRMYSFLTSEGMMYKKHFGFRKHHSTAHAINYSINQIINELQQKKHKILFKNRRSTG